MPQKVDRVILKICKFFDMKTPHKYNARKAKSNGEPIEGTDDLFTAEYRGEKIKIKGKFLKQGEERDLSDVMFSIFTLDEIRTIIKHRQFRGMKTLQMSKDKQDEFSEVIKKIEDMFDV